MTTYNPGTPQPQDIPADSQDEFVSNFGLLNEFFGVDHVPFGTTVTFATSANPCVCTAPNHGLTTGNTINIKHFGSLVGDVIKLWAINGGPYTVTVIDANTFSINANSSAEPEYLANTGAFSCVQFKYGYHTKTYFPSVLSQGPNTSPPRGSPYSAYYSKTQKNVAELFFQNGVGKSFEHQMTNLDFVEVSTETGKGIITPWGIIINMGQIHIGGTPRTITFPIPYKNAVWSIIGIGQRSNVFLVGKGQYVATGLATFDAREGIVLAAKFPVWYFAIGV